MTLGGMQIQTERNDRERDGETEYHCEGQEVSGGLEFSNGGFSQWVALSDCKGHVSLNIKPNRSHHHSTKELVTSAYVSDMSICLWVCDLKHLQTAGNSLFLFIF